jgi:glutathione S-transferase
MLTVHHLATSQSDRIVWLCEELGIAYELKRYERDPVTRLAPPEYRALHAIGTAPVITDGDLVLGESAAIVEYIIQRHGQSRLAVAPGDAAYPDYLFWFHYANGSFMPAAMMGLVAGMVAAGGSAAVGALTQRLDRAWDMVEARLGQSPYLAGTKFTAADIMTMFPLTTMRLFAPRELGGYPNVAAYLQRIAARDAFQRAMAKADPGFVLPLN